MHKSFKTRQEAQVYVGTNKPGSILSSINAASARFSKQAPKLAGRASPPPFVPPPSLPASTASSASPVRPPRPTSGPALSPSQLEILDRIVKGENFFFTGSAGTGKSVLLRAIISEFKQREYAERQAEEEKRKEMVERYMSGQMAGLSGDDVDGMSQGASRWNLAVTASTGMAAV